eukprot:TRINITY_DN3787_c0_g1_i7.p1 TRINITY_DN3787_c0_g1~~TRINITY_DN3787_c0_g1_i7.p1  ORF type:complete len:347 (+),score=57.58 TRINITY_DN3787_c0_g1_i7:62-1042(+)
MCIRDRYMGGPGRPKKKGPSEIVVFPVRDGVNQASTNLVVLIANLEPVFKEKREKKYTRVIRSIFTNLNPFDEFPKELLGAHKMQPVFLEMERIALKCCLSSLNLPLLVQKFTRQTVPASTHMNLGLDTRVKEMGLKFETDDEASSDSFCDLDTLMSQPLRTPKSQQISIDDGSKDLVEIDEIIEVMYGKYVQGLKLYQIFAVLFLSVRTYVTTEFYRELITILYCLYLYDKVEHSEEVDTWNRRAVEVFGSAVTNFFHQEDHIAANLFKDILEKVWSSLPYKKSLILNWPRDHFEDVILLIKAVADILKECDLAFQKEISIFQCC